MGKGLLMQQLLARYDEVLCIDADAVILDPTRDITDQLLAGDLMGLTARHTRGSDPIPNTGVWLVRRDRAVVDFLDMVWDSPRFVDHKWWDNEPSSRHSAISSNRGSASLILLLCGFAPACCPLSGTASTPDPSLAPRIVPRGNVARGAIE